MLDEDNTSVLTRSVAVEGIMKGCEVQQCKNSSSANDDISMHHTA